MSVKDKHKGKKKRSHSSDSGSDSEHELYYYANDRVRLMKEVLKILKLKKIKSLAPDGIKTMDMEEINTLLLEELLGISNKRLKRIFLGLTADDESSSSDEDKTVDIISLDSISDDEICFVDETKDDGTTARNSKNREKHKHKKHKVKKEPTEPKIKTETKTQTTDLNTNEKSIDKTTGLENEKLLSVLELLELQARARAIRSQLALEAENKAKEKEAKASASKARVSDDDDAVVIEGPTVNEIVISSSDSEAEAGSGRAKEQTAEKPKENGNVNAKTSNDAGEKEDNEPKKTQKIKLIRSIIVEPAPEPVSEIPLPISTSAAVAENEIADVECSNGKMKDSGNDMHETERHQQGGQDGEGERNQIESDDKTNDLTAGIENEGENEATVSKNKDEEANEEVIIEMVQAESAHVTVDVDNDIDKKKIGVIADQRRPSSDADDDVIRLDIVEIDGMDD